VTQENSVTDIKSPSFLDPSSARLLSKTTVLERSLCFGFWKTETFQSIANRKIQELKNPTAAEKEAVLAEERKTQQKWYSSDADLSDVVNMSIRYIVLQTTGKRVSIQDTPSTAQPTREAGEAIQPVLNLTFVKTGLIPFARIEPEIVTSIQQYSHAKTVSSEALPFVSFLSKDLQLPTKTPAIFVGTVPASFAISKNPLGLPSSGFLSSFSHRTTSSHFFLPTSSSEVLLPSASLSCSPPIPHYVEFSTLLPVPMPFLYSFGSILKHPAQLLETLIEILPSSDLLVRLFESVASLQSHAPSSYRSRDPGSTSHQFAQRQTSYMSEQLFRSHHRPVTIHHELILYDPYDGQVISASPIRRRHSPKHSKL
jgi:hypothetical protein